MAGKSAPFPLKNNIRAKARSRLQNGISQYFFFCMIFLKIKMINPVVVVGNCDSKSGFTFISFGTVYPFV